MRGVHFAEVVKQAIEHIVAYTSRGKRDGKLISDAGPAVSAL